MTTHTPAIALGHHQPSLPNQPFFSWLRTHTALFIGQIVGLLGAVSFLAALIYYSRNAGINTWGFTLDDISRFVVYAHLPFLVVFIAALIHVQDNNSRGRYRAGLVYEKLNGKNKDLSSLETYSELQVRRFKRRFLGFWCAMLLLYLAFGFEQIFPSPSEVIGRLFFPLLEFALNNVSLLFIFSCFVVLYLPTELTPHDSALSDETPADATPPGKKKSRHFLELIDGIVQKFSRRHLEELELRQRTLVVGFAFLVAALTLAFPLIMLTKIGVIDTTNWREYPAVFDALSGTVNAVVLALLIARLDSKLIALPSWLICILYSYAGVQPLFVVFSLDPNLYAGIKTAVFIVVFIFKIYFFLIIIYSLQTGRMFNYFFCSRILNDHVRTIKAQRSQTTSELEPGLVVADGNPPEHPTDMLSGDQASPRTEQNQVRKPAEDRWVLWSKGLGAFAIVYFAGSLLYYAARFGNKNVFVASPRLTHLVIYLHLPLLLIVSVAVFRAWHKGTRKEFPPSDPSRFRELSELRFKKLSEPGFKEVSEPGFRELSALTESQFKAFTKHFLLLWVSLLLLYVAFSVAAYREPKGGVPQFSEWPQSQPPPTANASPPSLTLTVEFAITARPSGSAVDADVDSSRKSQDSALPHSGHGSATTPNEKPGQQSEQLAGKPTVSTLGMLMRVKSPLLFLVLNNLTVLFVFWCFRILYVPGDDGNFREKHHLLFNYSVLITVLLTVLPPLLVIVIKSNGFTEAEVLKIPTIFATVGGTLNAVAFALLIARLDSRIIGLRSSLVSVLYGYAALQPLFVAFHQRSNFLRAIETSALIAAFLFKICLVLIVAHVKRSGGLNDYLWFFPILNRRVNSIFDNQFEIRAYSTGSASFRFSIFNKNVEVYKTETSYLSRAKCDEAVGKLRERMKERGNYGDKPQRVHGTYWIQVTNLEGEVICESTSLRTKVEAQDLIEESIEKIPYCKYDRG